MIKLLVCSYVKLWWMRWRARWECLRNGPDPHDQLWPKWWRT